MGPHCYLVALGSNMRHPCHGPPRRVLAAALVELESAGLPVLAASRMIETAPLGPSRRRYANAVAVIDCDHDPEELLAALHEIEHRFGRRRSGRAWGARVLDLDIVLWNGGAYTSVESDLVIPHRAFRTRRFVLDPAATIAGRWRDPLTGLSVQHLRARLTKPRSAPR